MKIKYLIANSILALSILIIIRALVSGLIRSTWGVYANFSFWANLKIAFTISFIYELPAIITYLVAFLGVWLIFKQFSALTIANVFVINILALIPIVTIWDMNDFFVLTRLGSVTWDEFLQVQINTGFQFITFFVFSIIFGIIFNYLAIKNCNTHQNTFH